MTASPSQDPGTGPFTGLDSTAQLMTRFTSQLTSQLHAIRPTHPTHPSSPSRSAMSDAPTLVAVGHGSRDPRAERTLRELCVRVRALRPGLRVELAHIELNAPLLPDALADLPAPGAETGGERGPGAGCGAVLVPLLFGRGFHVKHDIPRALAAAPHLDARSAAPLGPHPLLAEALYERLAEAGWGTPGNRRGTGPGSGAVVLAAAGSRDPEYVDGVERMAAQLSARLGGVPVLPAYASAAAPTVTEAVRALRARGHRRIGLASYFTAPGRFASECAAACVAAAPDAVVAAPVGAHTALARLVLHRYDESRTASRTASRAGAEGSVDGPVPEASLARA
ncbi:sirohydrochlorin chelatase [Streptomyces sp. NPDC054796]